MLGVCLPTKPQWAPRGGATWGLQALSLSSHQSWGARRITAQGGRGGAWTRVRSRFSGPKVQSPAGPWEKGGGSAAEGPPLMGPRPPTVLRHHFMLSHALCAAGGVSAVLVIMKPEQSSSEQLRDTGLGLGHGHATGPQGLTLSLRLGDSGAVPQTSGQRGADTGPVPCSPSWPLHASCSRATALAAERAQLCSPVWGLGPLFPSPVSPLRCLTSHCRPRPAASAPPPRGSCLGGELGKLRRTYVKLASK